eukprot:scaffold204_cov114-Skeletonema_marinoi.AAC.4
MGLLVCDTKTEVDEPNRSAKKSKISGRSKHKAQHCSCTFDKHNISISSINNRSIIVSKSKETEESSRDGCHRKLKGDKDSERRAHDKQNQAQS